MVREPRRLVALAVAATSACTAVFAAPSADAAIRRGDCQAGVVRFEGRNAGVELFSVRGPGGVRSLCARKVGAARITARLMDPAYQPGRGATRIRIAGRWVAYLHCPRSARHSRRPCVVSRRDLLTDAGGQLRGPLPRPETSRVSFITLSRSGVVAWLEQIEFLHGYTTTRALAARGTRVLDLGDRTDVTELSISGQTVRLSGNYGTPPERIRLADVRRYSTGRCRTHVGYSFFRTDGQVVLSERSLWPYFSDDDELLLRLCDVRTGHQRDIFDSTDGSWDYIERITLGGRFAAIATGASDNEGDSTGITLFGAARGTQKDVRLEPAQAAFFTEIDIDGLAVGADGSLAWIARDALSSWLDVLPSRREQRRVDDVAGRSTLTSLRMTNGTLHWRHNKVARRIPVVAPGARCRPPSGYVVAGADDAAILARQAIPSLSPSAWSCLRASGRTTVFAMDGYTQQVVGRYALNYFSDVLNHTVNPEGFKRYDLAPGQALDDRVVESERCLLAPGAAMACDARVDGQPALIAVDADGTRVLTNGSTSFWVDGLTVGWKTRDPTTGSESTGSATLTPASS